MKDSIGQKGIGYLAGSTFHAFSANTHYDIVVAGAGPAGLMAAIYASRYGAKVLLVERVTQRLEPVRCAEGIYVKALDKEINIPASCISAKISAICVHAPDGGKALFANLGQGYILHRGLYEDYLLAKALRRGVHFCPSTRVSNLSMESGAVKGILLKADTESIAIDCSILIAADGVESRLASMAGITAHLHPKDLHTTYQCLIKHPDINCDAIDVYATNDYAPGGYAWVFPKALGLANVGLGINAAIKSEESAKARTFRFINDHFPGAEILNQTGGGIPASKLLTSFSTAGFMVAGDAARLANPLTGGGIDTALVSGKLSGLIAAEAIRRHDPSARFLARYDRAIRKRYGMTNKIYYELKNRAVRMKDSRANQIVACFSSSNGEVNSIYAFFWYLLRRRPWMYLTLLRSLLWGDR